MSPDAAATLAVETMTCRDVDRLLDQLRELLVASDWRRDDTSRSAVLIVAWRLAHVAGVRDAAVWHYLHRLRQ